MSCNGQTKWRMRAFKYLLKVPMRNGIYKKKEFHGRGAKIVNMGELFTYSRMSASVEMKRVELTEKELEKFTLEPRDLVFARRSLTAEGAGKCSIILSVEEPTTFESSIIRARLDQDIADPEFYFYVFNSPLGKYLLGTILRQVAVAGITGGDLAKLEVPVPPIDVQEKISSILRIIDNKIELNHQINQTLEQMAQAIFKSWFVDFEPVKAKIAARERWHALQSGNESASSACYAGELTGQPINIDLDTYMNHAAMQAISGKDADQLAQMQAEKPEEYEELFATAELFPSAMQDSELGEIPEGWEVVTISDFGKVICGKTPAKKQPEFYGYDVPFIKIPDMHGQLFAVKTNEYLSLKGAASQANKAIPKGTVCVSCIATVGQVVITTQVSHTNQQINSIVPKEEIFTFYLYFRMLSLNKHLHDLASGGSATLNLNTGNFAKIQVLRPSVSVLGRYHLSSSNILNEVLNNSYEIQTLEGLRDTLLPKLLSGELSVADIESEVEA